jgi:hypothetical protein
MTMPFVVQAITTKYLAATDLRGSRVKATAGACHPELGRLAFEL